MTLRPLLIAATLTTLAMTAPAHAGLYGSNLSMMGYPAASCMKPWRTPTAPYSGDRYAVDSYNREVDSYNQQVRIYNECVRQYRNGARSDIERITREVDAITGRSSSYIYPGPSNLSLMGYPSAKEICGYKSDASRERCLLDYIDNAENDVRDIVSKANRL